MLKRRCTCVLVVLILAQAASACGPEWTYIGGPSGEPPPEATVMTVNRVGLTGDLLAGTWGSGIYRWSEQDTVWEYRSLLGYRITSLREFGNYPNALLATSDHGLLISHDTGMEWSVVTDFGTDFYTYEDCAISPLDTNEWAASASSIGSGFLYVSHDAGASWQTMFPPREHRDLAYSSMDAHVIFAVSYASLFRVHTVDSTREAVVTLPEMEVLLSMKAHPTEPVLWILGTRSITRYNEETNEVSRMLFPDSTIEATSLALSANNLLIGTLQGVYVVDEDLSTWTLVNDSVPPDELTAVYYASDSTWIAGPNFGSDLYCRAPALNVESPRSVVASFEVNLFPNPFNSITTLTLSLSGVSDVEVGMYDITGRHVKQIAQGRMTAGEHAITVDAAGLPNGVYFVRAAAGDAVMARKVVLLK
jgi:hypothetical protein